MPNVFDDLLGSIEENDRTVLTELAARNPKFHEFVADPKDIKKVGEINTWYSDHWDFDHNCTKNEYARSLRIQALEAQIAAAPIGDNMTFDEIGKFLDEKITAGVVVSPKQMKDELTTAIKAKETEFETYTANMFNAMSRVSTALNYVSQVHNREFNEVLDPEDLLAKANEAKAPDLKAFYNNTYVAERRAANNKAALDKQLADAREEGRKAALQERVMADNGQVPSLDGSPDLGHFQAKLQKIDRSGEFKSTVPADAELGRGVIARAAAHDSDLRAAAGAAA